MPFESALPGSNGLSASPPVDQWDDWVEYDAAAWPEKVERHYNVMPTVCFNCESACGMLAFVDKATGAIQRFEGHPLHPASRGRLCAKGPATINQVNNPERILYPLKRAGERGEGKWERVSWEQALGDIAARIRQALQQKRRDAVVYHVGRPGEDMFTERVLQTWGVDGHNSHTNVCSAGARLGYALWMGMDRPTPDHERAAFVLLLSAHLESGHYFQPMAQRLMGAKERGAKVAVIDTRLSNTATQADYWLAPWPGTESGMLLAIANHLIQTGQFDRAFLEQWVNWAELMADREYLAYLKGSGVLGAVPSGETFDDFVLVLKDIYRRYTFEWAAQESGVPAAQLEAVAQEVAQAGHRFASHVWRNAAAGNRGGWMVARTLFFLNVLTGSVGTPGGTLPSSWAKFVPRPHTLPAPVEVWNELHYPDDYPLSHFEMSFLLPYLLQEQKRTLDVYFTRVYNPVWTNPDGFAWIDMFQQPDRIGLHVALTPVWSETAQYADYVLPMGMGPERHDLHSYETHASQWIGFRQPVLRVLQQQAGRNVRYTYETNPGEVWEENEFWIELSWLIDPDGALGIRQHWESPYRPGEKITIEEYYSWIFEHSVPGLPAAAAAQGLKPLEYMRRYGAFELTRDVFNQHESAVDTGAATGLKVDGDLAWAKAALPRTNYRPSPGPFTDKTGSVRVGVVHDGAVVQGFPTPSGKLEFYSTTARTWGWPEYALPIHPWDQEHREAWRHINSQVHWSNIDAQQSEYLLLPTFRLPTLIHSRTNGAKWLHELSHVNPVWINPIDARRMGVADGELVRVETEMGSFVDRCWVTEAIRPGVVACSHHLGRWRLQEDTGSDRWNSALVRLEHTPEAWRMRQIHGAGPFASADPDSSRIWWSDGGVHQNITFPVQPDPLSGQHCWHQKVRVTKALGDAKYGDIDVHPQAGQDAFKRWQELCRAGPGPDGTRRPYWLLRPLKPAPAAYRAPGAPAHVAP